MVKRGLLLASAFMSVLLTSTASAATVLVDATQATNAGVVYNTIREAVNDFGTWSNGTDDTIELNDAGLHVIAAGQTPTLVNRVVTIRNAAGATPIIRADATIGGDGALQFRGGNYIVEGLTLIGPAAGTANGPAFYLRPNPDNLTITIRNCRILSNNGSDAPITDPSISAGSAVGNFNNGVMMDGVNGTVTNVTIEDSVIMRSNNEFLRMTSQPNAGSSLTFRNTLLCDKGAGGTAAIRLDSGPNMTFTMEESALIASDVNEHMLLVIGNGGHGAITISDCVFARDLASGGANDPLRFIDLLNSTLDIRRTTIFAPGRIAIRVDTNNPDTLRLHDIICYGDGTGIDALFFSTVSDTVGIANIDLNDGLLAEGGRGARSGSNAGIASAFAAINGGTGVLTTDPEYVSTAMTSALTGITQWDRTTNTLFDVNSVDLANKGEVGLRPFDALAGGADPTPNVPVELSDFSVE